MTGTIEKVAPAARSFYDKAAWCALFASPAYVALAIASASVLERFHLSALTVDHIGQAIILVALLVELLSCICGLVICCAIRRHTRRITIWIALLAILIDCGLGYFTLITAAVSNLDGC
jgi:ABC-type Fe3+ transport system permease subunit